MFDGELMKCVCCGAEQLSHPKVESGWRAIEANGYTFYVCPKELPGAEGTAQEFKVAYLAAIKIIKEKFRDRKCRVCGCTQEKACSSADGRSCYWVEFDLCSVCARATRDSARGPGPAPEVAEDIIRAMQKNVVLQLNIGQAMIIISALQLALRHPDFQGPNREFIRGFTYQVGKDISLTPAIKDMLDEGWKFCADVASESKAERRIIIP